MKIERFFDKIIFSVKNIANRKIVDKKKIDRGTVKINQSRANLQMVMCKFIKPN